MHAFQIQLRITCRRQDHSQSFSLTHVPSARNFSNKMHCHQALWCKLQFSYSKVAKLLQHKWRSTITDWKLHINNTMKQGNHIFHMHVAKKEKTEENQMEKNWCRVTYVDSINFKPILTCTYTNCKHASYLFNADTLTLNKRVQQLARPWWPWLWHWSVNQLISQSISYWSWKSYKEKRSCH